MAKESALWDDSALINAFNDAMTKYRHMHKKPSKGVENEGSCEIPSENHEDECGRVVETTRHISYYTVGNISYTFHVFGNIGSSEERDAAATGASSREFYASPPVFREAGEFENSQQDHSAGEIDVSEPNSRVDHTHASMQTNSGDPSNVQNIDHSHLVNHYHNLEQQRQEVLQQLYQINGWNSHAANEQATSNAPWTGCGSSQYTQDGSYYPSYLPMQPYCHPYPYCWPPLQLPCVVPCRQCSSTPPWFGQVSNNFQDSCRASTSLKDTVESSKPSLVADGITAAIMEAVKKATSAVKTEISGAADVNEGEVKTDNSGEESLNADLTEMLHAWFSAGFYTARCLSGRASAEKKH